MEYLLVELLPSLCTIISKLRKLNIDNAVSRGGFS